MPRSSSLGCIWETIWRGAAAADVVVEAREWLAAELGANRAIYVALRSQPEGEPPMKPTPAGQPLKPPLELPPAQTSRGVVAGQGQAAARPLVRFRRSR